MILNQGAVGKGVPWDPFKGAKGCHVMKVYKKDSQDKPNDFSYSVGLIKKITSIQRTLPEISTRNSQG